MYSYYGVDFFKTLTRVKFMSTLAQIKLERLKAQTEREIITNEILKGTLVRWDDVKAVFGERIADARNQILRLPSMYADRLTREEVEQFRKVVYEALTQAADAQPESRSLKQLRKIQNEI